MIGKEIYPYFYYNNLICLKTGFIPFKFRLKDEFSNTPSFYHCGREQRSIIIGWISMMGILLLLLLSLLPIVFYQIPSNEISICLGGGGVGFLFLGISFYCVDSKWKVLGIYNFVFEFDYKFGTSMKNLTPNHDNQMSHIIKFTTIGIISACFAMFPVTLSIFVFPSTASSPTVLKAWNYVLFTVFDNLGLGSYINFGFPIIMTGASILMTIGIIHAALSALLLIQLGFTYTHCISEWCYFHKLQATRAQNDQQRFQQSMIVTYTQFQCFLQRINDTTSGFMLFFYYTSIVQIIWNTMNLIIRPLNIMALVFTAALLVVLSIALGLYITTSAKMCKVSQELIETMKAKSRNARNKTIHHKVLEIQKTITCLDRKLVSS